MINISFTVAYISNQINHNGHSTLVAVLLAVNFNVKGTPLINFKGVPLTMLTKCEGIINEKLKGG
jgi:hypothetical protein